MADEIRPEAAEALSEMRSLGFEKMVMLTGDHAGIARRVADQVGLAEFRSNCLPADKVAAVEALRSEFRGVAMVGDGINDTPALASASVGIAIGSSPQAMETADVTLLADDLRRLPFAVRLSRAAMGTIRFNIALSLAIKGVFFLLVLAGYGTMWMAVLADMGTSLLVTLNGIRLLAQPAPRA